ncbi:hypothetical protein [Rhodobaculum claviforme]|uniref:Uncharacterized protein n=1 Tax=Rhodobaculum claviforme TaxID=1549854 RepID=A0A934THS9_9RHOB|nr:hypothetical protein [Rhodobaculum claviforme]MBK5926167.1 hypothetical protein [Rhodobaculum claviforme]
MPRGGAGGDVDLLGMLEVLMPMPAHPLGARATAGPKDLADRGPQAAEQAAEQSVDAFAFDLRVRDSLGRIAAADLLRHGLDDPEEA